MKKQKKWMYVINPAVMFALLLAVTTYAKADQLAAPVTVKTFSNVSTVVTITNTGRVGIGTTAPAASLHVVDSILTAERGIVSAQHNDGAHGAIFAVKKSRGTELDPKPLVCPDPTTGLCDYVGAVVALAWNKSNYERTAQIGFRTDQTPSDPNNTGTLLNPTAITFVVGASGTTLHEAMRITSSGKIGIGTDSPNALLEVKNGGIRINTETTTIRPACDATTRGTFWVTTGSTSDSVSVCLLKSSGLYKWRTLVSGADDEHEAGNNRHKETD